MYSGRILLVRCTYKKTKKLLSGIPATQHKNTSPKFPPNAPHYRGAFGGSEIPRPEAGV